VTAKLGKAPILLLDDVFSELDEGRSIALAAGVPPGQSLVTSAVHLPPSMVVDLEIAMGNSSDLADV
jgi:DNA replication and repair protein RecF